MLDALLRDPETEALVGDTALLAAMVEVELALARAQERCGLIEPGSAVRMTVALAGFQADQAAITQGLRRSAVPVPALVQGLRQKLGPELGSFVHLGATSQDIVDTALVLQLRTALALLEERLRRVVSALISLAERHERTVMPARTRFQQALPTTFGLKVAGWLAPLVRDLERLGELRPRLLVVQLGGAAGTLSAMGEGGPAVMAGLADELGLGCPVMPWHSQRDGLVELASWLVLVTGALGKLGTDILLLAQSEVGEVAEAEGGGSSTMPQKANPIRAEALVTLARQNASAVSGMAQALVHAQERDGSAWQLEWLALPGMLSATGAALGHGLTLARSIVVDADRMRANLDAGHGLALAEPMSFALARHMPRHEAQALVAAACKAVRAEGRHLAELLAERVTLPHDWRALADPANHLGAALELQARTLAAARDALERSGHGA